MIPIRSPIMFDESKDVVSSENYASLRYIPLINTYVIAVTISWIAWYERYYYITEEDYNKGKEDFNYIKEKYPEAFSSVMTLPRGETFMGSANLRDYDGRERFTQYFTHGGNPFVGYFYDEEHHVLYADIEMYGNHFAVLPYRILEVTVKDENGEDKLDYVRPLEDLPDVVMINSSESGESIPLFMALPVDVKGNIIR